MKDSLCGAVEIAVNSLACYCLLLHLGKKDQGQKALLCRKGENKKARSESCLVPRRLSFNGLTEIVFELMRKVPLSVNRTHPDVSNHTGVFELSLTVYFKPGGKNDWYVARLCSADIENSTFPMLLICYRLAGSRMSGYEVSVFKNLHFWPSELNLFEQTRFNFTLCFSSWKVRQFL